MRKTVLDPAALLMVAGCLMIATGAHAGCPDDAAIKTLATDILAGTPTNPPVVASIEDGLCTQKKLVSILEYRWGKPIGYKAALTSKPAQDTFKVGEPVRGVLLANMMLKPGTKIPVKYGALPRYEADMIVTVASADINTATTPKEVLAHLSSVHPFIELPDLVVDPSAKLDGPGITSINAGARYGVLGDPIPVQQTDAFLKAFTDMTVRVTDQTGAQLVAVPGTAILGHPLNAVLWLRKNGVTFKPGDVVSLGSFGPQLAPKAGLTATTTYVGFPGNPAVSVTFE